LGGYGGGGFIDPGKGERPVGGPQGRVFDEDLYIETIPSYLSTSAARWASNQKLLHDAQEHFTP